MLKVNPIDERPDILIRSLAGMSELRSCLEAQRRIWGFADVDLVPHRLFAVAQKSGGQVLGAFCEEEMVGFALSFAGVREGTGYLHSHMVGIIPEYQNRGIGRSLKLAQREDALKRGFELIEWTFDPLQLKNARFNIAKLGAIVRRYIPDCYGSTSSPLHAGLPTDRVVCEWWINSARVQERIGGHLATSDFSATRIPIPAEVGRMRSCDPAQAEKIQTRLRSQFEMYFTAGYAAVGFEFDTQYGSYILERYED